MKINTSDPCQFIGNFTITGGQAVITDPCYSLEKLQLRISNVKNGTWKGYVHRKIDPRALAHRNKRIAEIEAQGFSSEKEKAETEERIKSYDPELAELLRQALKSDDLAKKELENLKKYDCGRVSMLSAYHENVNQNTDDEWVHVGSVGVDSGQMSISDLKTYITNPLHEGGKMEFVDGKVQRNYSGAYWKICDLTGKSFGAGIFEEFAIASQSGWGDGEYDVFVLMNGNDICGLAVMFISPDDNGDD